jgi:hypothetical protein
MQFTHYDLGHRQRGEIVEISLSGSAAIEFFELPQRTAASLSRGQGHAFAGTPADSTFGPLARDSRYAGPARLGENRNARASECASPMREAPLSSVPSLVQGRNEPPGTSDSAREYDVFVSHASEDKDEVVRPLAHALQAAGLSVWYDEFELRIGDSLRRKIDMGLAKSRFGVVVLSASFFEKGWTNYELDGIVTRAVSGDQVLLPIWHEVTKKQVIEYSPSLADKLARNTATHTVEEIAAEIAEVIRGGAA